MAFKHLTPDVVACSEKYKCPHEFFSLFLFYLRVFLIAASGFKAPLRRKLQLCLNYLPGTFNFLFPIRYVNICCTILSGDPPRSSCNPYFCFALPYKTCDRWGAACAIDLAPSP